MKSMQQSLSYIIAIKSSYTRSRWKWVYRSKGKGRNKTLKMIRKY